MEHSFWQPNDEDPFKQYNKNDFNSNSIMKGLLYVMFMVLFISAGCTNPRDKELTEDGPDMFTWDLQRAGYDYAKCDEMGAITHLEFVREFDNYPWIEEIEKANRIPGKCSPTLSVSDQKTRRDFWISMAGDRQFSRYYVGYIYTNKNNTRWLEMYTTESYDEIIELINYFFHRDYNRFESKIRSFEFEGEMESEDLAK